MKSIVTFINEAYSEFNRGLHYDVNTFVKMPANCLLDYFRTSGLTTKGNEHSKEEVIDLLKMKGVPGEQAEKFYDLMSSDTIVNCQFGLKSRKDDYTFCVWLPGKRKNLFKLENMLISPMYWAEDNDAKWIELRNKYSDYDR